MSNHKYKDAFCIFWFACKCGHQEKVWNSRDNYIPSNIICSSCGKMAGIPSGAPVEYDPKHQLNHGQKFFRDGTPEEAIKLATAHADKVIKNGSMVPGQEHMVYIEEDRKPLIEAILKKFKEGWPCVDVYGKLGEY